MARKIIIDTDPGQDDAIALLLAFASPELEILGISTVAGNVELRYTTRNALQICELAQRHDIPVFPGADSPLSRELVTAKEVHGKTGMEGASLPEPSLKAQSTHAVDWLISMLEAQQEITICLLGPMTNLALALQRAPHIGNHIKEVVFMGGARKMGGNITPAAEFNVFVDPDAAEIVLQSGIPLVMHPLDVTHKANMTQAWIESLLSLGKGLGTFCHGILQYNYAFSMGVFKSDIAPLHDPCVIAYLLYPDMFSGKACAVAVETQSELTMGMTVIDWWDVTGKKTNCFVVDEIDAGRFFHLIFERLQSIAR